MSICYITRIMKKSANGDWCLEGKANNVDCLSEKSYIQEKMFWTGVSGGIAATIPSMILFLVLICCYHPSSNLPDCMY